MKASMLSGKVVSPSRPETANAIAQNAVNHVALGNFCSCNQAKAAARRSSTVPKEKTF